MHDSDIIDLTNSAEQHHVLAGLPIEQFEALPIQLPTGIPPPPEAPLSRQRCLDWYLQVTGVRAGTRVSPRHARPPPLLPLEYHDLYGNNWLHDGSLSAFFQLLRCHLQHASIHVPQVLPQGLQHDVQAICQHSEAGKLVLVVMNTDMRPDGEGKHWYLLALPADPDQPCFEMDNTPKPRPHASSLLLTQGRRVVTSLCDAYGALNIRRPAPNLKLLRDLYNCGPCCAMFACHLLGRFLDMDNPGEFRAIMLAALCAKGI